jgi:hypothetical protein
MTSTDGVETEDEHLLSDPEKRAARAHTGHSVARFLASVVTFAVCFVLALHAIFGPDIGTAVSRAAEPAEAAAEISRREERREAESLLSSIQRIASREDAPVVAARVAHDPASLGKRDSSKGTSERARKKTTRARARPDASSAKPPNAPEADVTDVTTTPATTTPKPMTLGAPLYLVGAPGDDGEDEQRRADENVARLARAFGEDAVVADVRVLPGVDARRWPSRESLQDTVYALKSVFKVLGGDHRRPDFRLVRDLPWVGAVATRDAKTGKLAAPWTHDVLATPLGSLFSHMRVWQSALDANAKRAFFVENGALSGLRPSHLGVPLVALGAVAANAPADADVVILNQPLFGGVGEDVVSRFADAFGNAIEIRRWRQRGVAGAGAYMFTDAFVSKVFKHVAKHGADAPDAWLLDAMCASDALDARGAFVGFDARDAVAPALRCYKASGVRAGEDGGEERAAGEAPAAAREAGDGDFRDGKKKENVAAVGAETAELRRRIFPHAGDARAEAAREARAYVDARAAEAAKIRAYVEKARIRTTEDTL